MTRSAHFPRCPIGKRFCQFFPHRYHFIQAPATSDRPQWETESRYPIEHRNLWHRFQDPQTLLGVSFGPSTHYALLDIDRHSPYHPEQDESAFKALLGAYEDIGLNDPILVQSSLSEGLHVYFVFPKALPTFPMAQLLKLTAITAGFAVKDGTLEIFPNAKRYNPDRPTPYKAHRLPLQLGSYLLDSDYAPYSNQIATFLDRADDAAAATDIDLLETALAASQARKAFRYIRGDGAKAAAFAADLKGQIDEGWSDFGQTNDLLRVIGTYGRVFEALSGSDLADYIAQTAQQLPGYREFCRHQHQIQRRAREWARCVEKFYYPYGEQPRRMGCFADMQPSPAPRPNLRNDTRQQDAIERITQGMAWLRQQLEILPKRVGAMKEALTQAIETLFGLRPSDKTLYRHRELWHPAFIGAETGVASDNADQAASSTVTETASRPSPASSQSQPCPTPTDSPAETVEESESNKSASDGDLTNYAPPPLNMKVKQWISDGVELIYQGPVVSSLVKFAGQRRMQLASVYPGDRVVLVDAWHSSFWFSPHAVDQLKVYVQVRDRWDPLALGSAGVAVLVRDLVFDSD